MAFGFMLSSCYNVLFFVILLLCFICVQAIQTDKANSIKRKQQIKLWSSICYITGVIDMIVIIVLLNLEAF